MDQWGKTRAVYSSVKGCCPIDLARGIKLDYYFGTHCLPITIY